MPHVVLLGDSVFDNSAYVRPGEPDVARQLQARLPGGWRTSLLAVDGHATADVARQLERLPPNATHLVVSVGGNDALRQVGVLEEAARSVGGAAARLADVREEFARSYRAMLAAVLAAERPAALGTIYDPRFPDASFRRLAVAALALFNDVILREAAGQGLPVLDLRLVCGEDADFANPIEPSARGGDKIARAIARLLAGHDFGRRRTEVFAR